MIQNIQKQFTKEPVYKKKGFLKDIFNSGIEKSRLDFDKLPYGKIERVTDSEINADLYC